MSTQSSLRAFEAREEAKGRGRVSFSLSSWGEKTTMTSMERLKALKEAFDKGAVSEREYLVERNVLIADASGAPLTPSSHPRHPPPCFPLVNALGSCSPSFTSASYRPCLSRLHLSPDLHLAASNKNEIDRIFATIKRIVDEVAPQDSALPDLDFSNSGVFNEASPSFKLYL